MKRRIAFVLLSVVFVTRTPRALAQQDVKAGLTKSIWTAEAIRAIRASNDYNALLALVVTEAATKANLYPSPDELKQAIVRAQQLAAAAPIVTLDPDLNPATFREMLRRLRNTGILPAATITDLTRELSRSAADLTEEEAILRDATIATKATFASFMQQHLMGVYELADQPTARSILTTPIGSTSLPDTHLALPTLITQSHLPDGPVKAAILDIANSGTVNPDKLTAAATGALRTVTTRFDDARNTFQAIVSRQPHFDTLLSPAIPSAVQDKVAVAQRLLAATPDQLEQFDTLRTVANLIPLPPNVSNTIQTVAQIGSTIQSTISTVSHVASSLSTLGSVASIGMSFLTTGGIGALAGSLGSVLGGGGPSNQEILDAVNHVAQQVEQLHTEMIGRFDQVDRELQGINAKLDDGFRTLGAQLADMQIDLRRVVATTSSIELTILEDRDTLQRAVINTIGLWNENDLKELHRNLVELLAALDRADARPDDLTKEGFRKLAHYFTTLARTEAGKGALTGLQPAENYALGFAATRLARKSNLYPVNYTMTFPVAGVGTPTLQNLLTGTEANRDFSTQPYVNERVWAIAANALATMIERWPGFANEVPGLRDGLDAVIKNGRDLGGLAKALQTPETLPSKPISKPFTSTLQAYQRHVDALHAAIRNALRDEAVSYGRDQALSQEQITALSTAFAATQTTSTTPIDGVTNGTYFVRSKITYTPPSLNAALCNGTGPAHQITGTPLTGYGLQQVREALALKTGVLSACLTIPYYISERDVTVSGHGGYGIVGHGAPCAADTVVTMKKLAVEVQFMFRLASDPDDAAHRIVIALARVAGPETEDRGRIVGQPHWSGQPTEPGHDWNSECHSPHAWHIGDTNSFYMGNAAYINATWNALAAGFSESYVDFGTYPYASGNRQAILASMRAQDTTKLFAVYSNLRSDLAAVLHQPAPAPQNRIVDVATISNEVHALEGVRALLRELTTIAYERTLSRDDVLSGLLFGTDGLPGGTELLQTTSTCDPGPIDYCLAQLMQLPRTRAERLAERLALVNKGLQAGTLTDSHRLIDATLDRLGVARCVVPTIYNGKADCNGQR